MDIMKFNDLSYEEKLRFLVSDFNRVLVYYNDVVVSLKRFKETIDRSLPMFKDIEKNYVTNKLMTIMTYGEDLCVDASNIVNGLDRYDQKIKEILSTDPGIVQIGNTMNEISSSLNYIMKAFNNDKSENRIASDNINDAFTSIFKELSDFDILLKLQAEECLRMNFKKSSIEGLEYSIGKDKAKAANLMQSDASKNNSDLSHSSEKFEVSSNEEKELDVNFNSGSGMPEKSPENKKTNDVIEEKLSEIPKVESVKLNIISSRTVDNLSKEAITKIKPKKFKKIAAIVCATVVGIGLVVGGLVAINHVTDSGNTNDGETNQVLGTDTVDSLDSALALNGASIEDDVVDVGSSQIDINVEVTSKFLNSQSLSGYDIGEYSDLLNQVTSSLNEQFDKGAYREVVGFNSDYAKTIAIQADEYKSKFSEVGTEDKNDLAKNLYEFLGNIKYSDLANLSSEEAFTMSVLLNHLKDFGVTELGNERFIPINVDGVSSYMTVNELEARLIKLQNDSSVDLGKAQEEYGVYPEGTSVDYALSALEESKTRTQ